MYVNKEEYDNLKQALQSNLQTQKDSEGIYQRSLQAMMMKERSDEQQIDNLKAELIEMQQKYDWW